MQTTTYKITCKGVKGAAYAQYENGILRTLINDLEGDSLTSEMIRAERSTREYTGVFNNYTVTELIPKSVADKVALFCIKHKELMKFTYRATKIEKANLKEVTVNEEYLKIYFTNTTYPLSATKSMADYVRHYNTVRNIAINGTPVKVSKEFPDVYDREFEKRISDDVSKLERYWAHLRNLGWRKQDSIWKSPQQLL